MTKSRLFVSVDQDNEIIYTETDLFEELKKEVNFALREKIKLILKKKNPQLRAVQDIQENLIELGGLFVEHVNTMTRQKQTIEQLDESELHLENIGINHIINYINCYANGLQNTHRLEKIDVNNLLPHHQFFFRHEPSVSFVLKTALLGIGWLAGTLSMTGYGIYSLYSAAVKSTSPYLAFACAAGCLHFTPILMVNVMYSERVHFMQDLFGDKFEHIKKLCARYHELTYEKITVNDNVSKTSV